MLKSSDEQIKEVMECIAFIDTLADELLEKAPGGISMMEVIAITTNEADDALRAIDGIDDVPAALAALTPEQGKMVGGDASAALLKLVKAIKALKDGGIVDAE